MDRRDLLYDICDWIVLILVMGVVFILPVALILLGLFGLFQ